MFPRDEKLLPVEKIFEKLEQISLARKLVSTSQNKIFVVKINLHQAEERLNRQENLKNEKKKKKLVSTSQKTRLH